MKPGETAGSGAGDLRGQRNRYTCELCSFAIVTEDVDIGVTPFMLACRNPVPCRGTMTSAFYRVDPTTPAAFEWYRPTAEELKRETAATRDHVIRGGLLLRVKARA